MMRPTFNLNYALLGRRSAFRSRPMTTRPMAMVLLSLPKQCSTSLRPHPVCADHLRNRLYPLHIGQTIARRVPSIIVVTLTDFRMMRLVLVSQNGPRLFLSANYVSWMKMRTTFPVRTTAISTDIVQLHCSNIRCLQAHLRPVRHPYEGKVVWLAMAALWMTALVDGPQSVSKYKRGTNCMWRTVKSLVLSSRTTNRRIRAFRTAMPTKLSLAIRAMVRSRDRLGLTTIGERPRRFLRADEKMVPPSFSKYVCEDFFGVLSMCVNYARASRTCTIPVS